MINGKSDSRSDRSAYFHLILSGCILAGLLGVIIWLVATSQIGGWDFRNNLWAPSYLLLRGESPYDLSGLYELGNPVWLPMAIGALFPVGALPLPQAAMVWRLVNFGAVVGIVWVVAGQKRPSPALLAVALLAVALYPRTLAHVSLGQFSLFAVLLYVCAGLLLQRQRFWPAALPVAVALAKPQLGILVVVGLALRAYRLQGRRGAAVFVTAVVVWCALLTLPLFLLYPGWAPDFILSLRQNPAWLQPSLFSLLPAWLGQWPGMFGWGLLFLLVMGLNGWLWWKRPFWEAMCWSLALTPLVSPYIWSWDFVLLLPLLVREIFRLRLLAARFVLAMGYLLNWFLMFQVILSSDGSDHHFWWGSWFLVAVIFVAVELNRRFEVENGNER